MTTAMTCSLASGWTAASAGDFVGGEYTGDIIQTGYGWQVPWPNWWPEYHYHYYTPYIQPITVTRDVKVTLKFSEVDRLRKAAQKDAKLKAVLEKLTPCIEVVVDLEETK